MISAKITYLHYIKKSILSAILKNDKVPPKCIISPKLFIHVLRGFFSSYDKNENVITCSIS